MWEKEGGKEVIGKRGKKRRQEKEGRREDIGKRGKKRRHRKDKKELEGKWKEERRSAEPDRGTVDMEVASG